MYHQLPIKKYPVLLGLALLGFFSTIAQGAVVFTQGPTLAQQGDSVVLINFTVSESTDVEVGIANADGKIINHLAAGVLGGKYAPPAPLISGLTQSIAWNITDDDGNRVFGDDYKVRVRLGVKPKFVWKNVISRLWKPSLSVQPGIDMWGDRRNLFWQVLQTGGTLQFTMIPAAYKGYRYAYNQSGVNSDSAIMVLLKSEADFYVAERNDQPAHPYLSRYTATGERIVTSNAVYNIYKAHGQAGDRMFLPAGVSSGGNPIRFCFVDKSSYVLEADDPWNQNPQTDFLSKWHPLVSGGQTPWMINLNSEPGGDVFTRNGADALTRYDAATGQVLQTITWGSQFYPYYCCWMGSFLAYDLKRQLLYIFNPAYNKAPDSATAPNQGFGVLYRLNMSDGSPAPWQATGKHYVSGLARWNGFDGWMGGDKGVAVGPDGDVYMNSNSFSVTSGYKLSVKVVKDGVLIDANRIRVDAPFSTVKVDRMGNIYVGAVVKPRGQWLPEDEMSLLNPAPGYVDVLNIENYTNCILKFPPTGGSLVATTAGDYDYSGDFDGGRMLKSNGLTWGYFGFSKVCGANNACWCSTGSFDLDKWGRLFVPNTMQAEMTALDNNRNVIYKVKNRDLPEAGGIIPGNLAVTENYLIASDGMNATACGFLLTAQDSNLVTIPSGWVGLSEKARIPALFMINHYPNPAFSSTRMKISVLNSTEKNIKVAVFNLKGELLATLTPGGPAGGSTDFIWDTRGIAGSVYLIKAVVGKRVLMQKAVVFN